MIKELISDLSYDRIKLSQALTRSKIIAYKINNTSFKTWLQKELEGYTYNDNYLPEYRKIDSQLFLTFKLPTGQTDSKPLFVDKEYPDLYQQINYCQVQEPIAVIEPIIEMIKDRGQVPLTLEQAQTFVSIDTSIAADAHKKYIVGGYREVFKGQYQNIIELTKQKLLDILLQLDDEFPNLINEKSSMKANEEKIQNIITNNIYGNNNPMSIASGQTVEQRDINNSFETVNFSELENLGVEKKDIETLKIITSENKNNKSKLKEKAMKWLGNVSASVAGRGLYDSIPAITDFITIQKLT